MMRLYVWFVFWRYCWLFIVWMLSCGDFLMWKYFLVMLMILGLSLIMLMVMFGYFFKNMCGLVNLLLLMNSMWLILLDNRKGM